MSILEFTFISPGSSGIDFFAWTFESEGNSFLFFLLYEGPLMHLSILHCLKLFGILVILVWPRFQIFGISFQILLMPQFRALNLNIFDPSFSSGE